MKEWSTKDFLHGGHCDIKDGTIFQMIWGWLNPPYYFKTRSAFRCEGCGMLIFLAYADPVYADSAKMLKCCSEGCADCVRDAYGDSQ